MAIVDWIDKHYRTLVRIAGFVAVGLLMAGWIKTSAAFIVAYLAVLTINAVKLSRDPSEGKFPPNG